MPDDPKAEIAALTSRLQQVEERLALFEQLRVDEASGGGQLTVGKTGAVLRINALTESGQQLP